MDKQLVNHLQHQSTWLRDSWLWLMNDRNITSEKTALEVGCGAGHVMEIMARHFQVTGIDNDPAMVELCKSKGLAVELADAEKLPFAADSFDIVYCSFLLLWLPNPAAAISEMARVARKWVICLGEPDYGGRIDFPPEMQQLGEALIADLQNRGADPFIGRKLRKLFADTNLNAEIGIHQGVWPTEKLQQEIGNEMVWISDEKRPEIQSIISQSGNSLFQFNPVFYCIAKIK